MTYGLNPQLFVEDGPTIQAGQDAQGRSTRAFHAWQAMDAEQKLRLVDCALQPATNDNLSDGFPAAL